MFSGRILQSKEREYRRSNIAWRRAFSPDEASQIVTSACAWENKINLGFC